MSEDLDRVSLTTAIDALRRQIREAAERAEGLGEDEPKFRITAAELELTVVAEDASSAGAEVGWWILKGSADVSAKNAITHKVKLSLNLGDIRVGARK
jgi:Trypsin-co-occurring domain 2